MELTGTPFLVALALTGVAVLVATLALWSRVPGPPAVRVGQRLALLVTGQLVAVLLAGALVNDEFGLYESWSDLIGSNLAGSNLAGSNLAGGAPAVATLRGMPGSGRVRHEEVTGSASGVRSTIWVLLPNGYDDPANATHRYPVIEFFSGYPGTPTTWLHALQLQRVLDEQVAAGRMPPVVAVLPVMNVAAPRDTECVDVAGGPRVATWLAVDVPQIIGAQLRVLPTGRAWGLTGYSTGGFCAAKLLLQFPHRFGSAAVVAGYFSPSNDVTTGDLFGGNVAAAHANDPQWLVTHGRRPPVGLLAVASDQDPETFGPTRAFLAAARPPLRTATIVLPRGGHNTGVWLGVEPTVLQWLGSHLATS